MYLDKKQFHQVVKNSPLVSIDFLIENNKGQFLFGKRLNEPAKGYWFVPGGRIMKNETLGEGFSRLSQNELGSEHRIENSIFKGVYEHFYESSMFDVSTSTHYVALAYQILVDEESLNLPCDLQHSNYRWEFPESINGDQKIHKYSKSYFNSQ